MYALALGKFPLPHPSIRGPIMRPVPLNASMDELLAATFEKQVCGKLIWCTMTNPECAAFNTSIVNVPLRLSWLVRRKGCGDALRKATSSTTKKFTHRRCSARTTTRRLKERRDSLRWVGCGVARCNLAAILERTFRTIAGHHLLRAALWTIEEEVCSSRQVCCGATVLCHTAPCMSPRAKY